MKNNCLQFQMQEGDKICMHQTATLYKTALCKCLQHHNITISCHHVIMKRKEILIKQNCNDIAHQALILLIVSNTLPFVYFEF